MGNSSQSAIFIAATGQNVGKTTTCLGILAALKERFSKVGFMKPVGQKHLRVEGGLAVDKDVVLFKEHFALQSSYQDMSPVIFSSGFTRDCIDGKVDTAPLLQSIKDSYEHIRSSHDFTIVEGTGHVGVGSVASLSNATVAAALGLDIVIIASGGIGSCLDELALNALMCRQLGVQIRGVILNRVWDNKREMVLKYVGKALGKASIPLLGCIAYNPFLNTPCFNDLALLLEAPILAGKRYAFRHFEDVRLVATSVEAYKEVLSPRELIITPASREDIILATLERHEQAKGEGKKEEGLEGGLILTERAPPSPAMIDALLKADLPTLYFPMNSYHMMEMITSFTAKITQGDERRIEQAIRIVKEGVDFERLCNRTLK